jgi:hypothetical protein
MAAFEIVRRLDPDNPVLAIFIGIAIEARSGLDGLIACSRSRLGLDALAR